jgi:two-component system, chemotaxis family, sensor kinase Cph1
VSDQPVRTVLHEFELARLEACAREPIRTPGSIQPHGALLGLDPTTSAILVASENAPAFLGVTGPVLGRTLAEVAGPSFEAAIHRAAGGAYVENPLLFEAETGAFDAIVHITDDLVLVEFEPRDGVPPLQSASALYAVSHRLSGITDITLLRRETVRELRELTGFDRVMLYAFHPDGHGEVVAEERAADMEPYEGLHFPASDIPAQARALYISKLSRAIVGTGGESVALLTVGGELEPARIDLSDAELRSVSPHHLQFMRNMGQEATVSFSMVTDGVLTGMITCAHREARRLPFLQRRGIEVLANQVALQLSALAQVERLSSQVALRKTRADLVAQLAGTDDIAGTLVRGAVTVRHLIPADGAAVRVNGRTRVVGDTPPTAELEALHAHVIAQDTAELLASDALGVDHPHLAALAPSVTGVLMAPIGGAGDYLAFFRNEVIHSVTWLGDQSTSNRLTPLSPRTSFSSWSDSVSGTAPAWGDLLGEASELARDVESALLRRVESELAHLAMHDPLTGLSNRRGMLERLETALRQEAEGWSLTLLFIDLDGFKAVNDTFGHDVGDVLIATVGARILSVTRAGDTVARLGGDEFVVLCGDTEREGAEHIARRIIEEIGQPTVIEGALVTVTASVGIAVTDRPIEAAELLRLADEAMYRAKDSGKNRLSA